MDVNGSRFHLLLGESDWTAGDLSGTHYDTGRDELVLEPLPLVFPSPAGTVPLTPSRRRGAARDRFGSVYAIAPDPAQLLVTSAGTGQTTPFWPVSAEPVTVQGRAAEFADPARSRGSQPPPRYAGLAVTADGYLVVGRAGRSALTVFDLTGGGAPSELFWPDGLFEPFDLAGRPGGGVIVLDRAARRYWELDRSLRIITRPDSSPTLRDFGPLVPDPAGLDAARTVVAQAVDGVPLEPGPGAVGDPIAVDCASDGTVVVLFQRPGGGSRIRAYRDRVPVTPGLILPITGHDLAVLGPHSAGTGALVAVTDQVGDQSHEFVLPPLDPATARRAAQDLPQLVRYLPMRRHHGRALFAAEGRFWYDSDGHWVPLTEHPRRRFATSGQLVTAVLDGQDPGCVWHRLLMDVQLPSGTAIRVESASSDRADDLRTSPDWRPEPDPYQRRTGSELPFAQPTGHQTAELAFQHARGRYLRLRLTLVGNGRATPRIRALRAYFPRFSYLEHYLPAVYREDAASASFLDRWLANVEGMATGIEDRIAAAQVLFDPRVTPPSALEWLASWFELALDPAWPATQRRLLLRHAMTFFAWRGTMRGLRTALALTDPASDESIFTDPNGPCARRIRIVELFRTKRTPAVALGDPSGAAWSGSGGVGGWWSPADGAQVLHEAWAASIAELSVASSGRAGDRLPLLAPPDADLRDRWRSFTTTAFGFVPVPVPVGLWRGFLVRRYTGRGRLLATYDSNSEDLGQVQPPDHLPDEDHRLRDWYQAQTVLLPAADRAHRFRVLLPVGIGDDGLTGDSFAREAARTARRALVRRVIELEKPAHTTFDVHFYWDAFRVGEARLGTDTLVGLGSRSPALLTPAVLDRGHLGENVLVQPDPDTRIRPGDRLADRSCR